MNRYIPETKDGKQADALIRYLKSLDSVQVKSIKNTESTMKNGIAKIKALLTSLPDQPHKVQDVNKAVKDFRKKNDYQ